MWKLSNCDQVYFIERVPLIMVLHSQVTFSRSKMSSQEEGDYVDMLGLVFTYFIIIIFLNKDILLLLANDFICDMCYFPWVILFLVGEPFSFYTLEL